MVTEHPLPIPAVIVRGFGLEETREGVWRLRKGYKHGNMGADGLVSSTPMVLQKRARQRLLRDGDGDDV